MKADDILNQWESTLREDRTSEALDFFVQQGWTPAQSAGIVANLSHESDGLDPNRKEYGGGKGFGLAQWTSSDRKHGLFDYAAKKGEKSPSFQTQLEYVQQELIGPESKAGELLRSAQTPEDATRIFSDHYERPGKPLMKSRLSRTAEIVGRFLGPSEAMAVEGPKSADAILDQWEGGSADSLLDQWDADKNKSFTDQLAEHPAVKPYLDRAKDVARLPGQTLGLVNATLAGPMGVFRRYNELRDFSKIIPKAKPVEKTFEDKWVATPESSKDDKWFKAFNEFGVGAKGMRDPGRAFVEQFMTSGEEAIKSARESIFQPGEWGANSGELWHLALGMDLEDALPEKLKWAAPSLTLITDVLSDPAVGLSVIGKKMWEHTAKSVLGADLFKDLAKVGMVPELEKLRIPQQVLDDFAKLEALEKSEKEAIKQRLVTALGKRQAYKQWQEDIIANPPIKRGSPDFPRVEGEPGAIRKPTVTVQPPPPQVMPTPVERAQLDLGPADYARAQIQRGAGIQPSAVADVRPQAIETPTVAAHTMQIVRDAAEQAEALKRRGPAPIQRGGMAPSVVGDVAPVERTTPNPMQRVMDMIEEQRRIRMGEAAPMPQRAAPIPDQSIAARVREMPVEVQQKLREVLPENVASKVLPQDVPTVQQSVKTAPEMIQTEQGMVPQKQVDQALADQIKADLAARKAAQGAQDATPILRNQKVAEEAGAVGGRGSEPSGSNLRGQGKVKEGAKPAGEVTQARVKQPWEMTRDEWHDEHLDDVRLRMKRAHRDEGEKPRHPDDVHWDAVKQALSEGKPVPPEVLKDYPDLKPAKAEVKVSIAESKPKPVTAKPAGEVTQARVKQPWEMTEKEFATSVKNGKLHQDTGRVLPGEDVAKTPLKMGEINQYSGDDIAHFYAKRRGYPKVKDSIKYGREELVRDAIYEGKPVPPEVLKDYPDLKPAKAKVPKTDKPEVVEPAPKAKSKAAKPRGDVYQVEGSQEAKGSTRKSLLEQIDKAIDKLKGNPSRVKTGERLKSLYSDRDILAKKYDKHKTGENRVALEKVEFDIANLKKNEGNVRFNFATGKGGYTVPNNLYALENMKKRVGKTGSTTLYSGLPVDEMYRTLKGAMPDLGPTDKAVRESMKADPEYQKLRGMIGEPEKRKVLPTVDHLMKEFIDRFHPIYAPSPETYVKMRTYSAVKDVTQMDFNKLRDGLKDVRNNFETFRDLVLARRAETRAKMWKESATKPNVANAQKVKITGPVKPGEKQYKWVWQVQNPNDMTLAEAQSIQKKLMKAYVDAGGNEQKMVNAMDYWDNWTKENMLDVAHRSGFISDEAYAAIRANNDHYATFSIIDHLPDMDKVPTVRNAEYFSVANQNIIMPTVGTTKKTLDPVEATLQKFLELRGRAARNDIANTFIDSLVTHPDIDVSQWARPIADNPAHFKRLKDAGLNPFAPDANLGADWDKISRFVNGKVEHWATKAEWAETLKGGMNEITIPKIINISNDVFKKGVTTAWLPFGITQVMIDSMAAFVTSPVYKWYDVFGKYQADLLKGYMSGARQEAYQFMRGTKSSTLQALGDMIGQSRKVDKYFRSGGGLGFMGELRSAKIAKDQLFNKRLADAEAKEIGGIVVRKLADIPKQLFIEAPSAIVGAAEHGPRLAVFERAMKQGKTAEEAAMLARDATIDFFKAGNKTRVLNMIVPFVNARVQGKVNVATASLFRGQGKADTWAKILSGVFVPAMAAWAWNHKYYGDHYKNIDSYIKDNYFTFIYGETTDEKTGKKVPKYLKFAKGDTGQAIMNPWEHVLEKFTGENPRETHEIAAQWLADMILPFQTMNEGSFDFGRTAGSLMPPLAKAPVEYIANKNLYTGRDNDPKWMLLEQVPAHLRGKATTPEHYKSATKYIYDQTGISMSPNQMQGIAGNLMGGYGRTGFDPEAIGTALKDRLVSTRATGNINRASKVYYGINEDYQQLRYTAIDMVKNGKGDEARSMLTTWNSNLRNRLSEMEKFGYRDKGGGMRDFMFSSDKIRNIITKGREDSDKPSDWLDERLQRRSSRRR